MYQANWFYFYNMPGFYDIGVFANHLNVYGF